MTKFYRIANYTEHLQATASDVVFSESGKKIQSLEKLCHGKASVKLRQVLIFKKNQKLYAALSNFGNLWVTYYKYSENTFSLSKN